MLLRESGRLPSRLAHLHVAGQPFDRQLLRKSRLYRRSRERYLQLGGAFAPSLMSPPRSLSSASLLDLSIEYSPVEAELIWSATDPVGSNHRATLHRLLETKKYCTLLFHEQNHRVLWTVIPSAPSDEKKLSRYLDLAESFTIALDVALGDELGAGAKVFYLSGVSYDPGSQMRAEKLSRSAYREFLQACMYSIYMKLEFFGPEEIRKTVHSLYPGNRRITELAIRRALSLEDGFVWLTNRGWKNKNMDAVKRVLCGSASDSLSLPADITDNRLHRFWADRWFRYMGL
jgi:hypothetical protein